MTKRGAEGVLDTEFGQARLNGGRGVYEVYPRALPSNRIGVVYHERHTYRTNFKGGRYGYDRTHTCWAGDFDNITLRGLRCYRSMREVVGLMLREVGE